MEESKIARKERAKQKKSLDGQNVADNAPSRESRKIQVAVVHLVVNVLKAKAGTGARRARRLAEGFLREKCTGDAFLEDVAEKQVGKILGVRDPKQWLKLAAE